MPKTNFKLKVPKNTVTPISKVVINLSLTDENAATFTIIDPENVSHEFAALSPPQTKESPEAKESHNFPEPKNNPRADRVLIRRDPHHNGDPRRKTCTIILSLNTDFDPNQFCESIMPTDSEEWQISVAGTQISGLCQVSSTRREATGCIGYNANKLIESTNPADLATIEGKANQQCGLERSGVDIVLVLDRSGSMSSPSQLGRTTMSRMQALHKAVTDFVGVWGDLIADDDQLGIVTFDDLVESPTWWIGAGLKPFNDTLKTTVTTNIAKVEARGSTTIGGGLIQGAKTLTGGSGSNRRIILLMSDGQQNTDPLIGAKPPTSPDLPPTYDVFTYNEATPDDITRLPGLSVDTPNDTPDTPYQIYTVTVGPSAVVAAAINDNIAKATGGFYINSEDNGNLLNPFFLELLGNFVRFNSWETARLIHGSVSDTQPYVTKFPLSTTTQRVVINLSWPQDGSTLHLSVDSPSGETQETQGKDGSVRLSFNTTGQLDPLNDWTLTVTHIIPVIPLGLAENVSAVSIEAETATEFDVVILVDDLAVKSDLLITPADYRAGDSIQLQMRLSVFGEPLAGLGSDPGDQVVVQVVRPSQSIGDLLSSSAAGTNPPQNGDKTSPVESKLFNMLQQNPNALDRNNDNPDNVVLHQTSPGVYAGIYQANAVGHYNFLFGVEGLTDGAGRFSRQEIKSVYVRAVPDAVISIFQTSILGSQLSIIMTPKTKTGNCMGPGWANYFWFTTPGQPPVKAQDNTDGTYSLIIPFTGLFPPSVSVHFLDVLMVIGDEVTPDRLPVPLDDSNVLIPDVSCAVLPVTRIPYIASWKVLGPIFDPAQQFGVHTGKDLPSAGKIIQDVDEHKDQLDPLAITETLDAAPASGEIVSYGGGEIFPERHYVWTERRFQGLDWESISDIGDCIHKHLSGDYDDDQSNPYNYLNFAGKQHALAFFLVYVVSPRQRVTEMRLRHDDAVRAWLNGEEIVKEGVLPFLQDRDIIDETEACVPIQLMQGTNILLVAIAESRVEWGFSARIEDYQGLRITTDNPRKSQIALCQSTHSVITIAGQGNRWNPKDPSRTLSCIGGHVWKGRVRMMEEWYKFVADGSWLVNWGYKGIPFGLNIKHDEPGIYDVIFDEGDPGNPVFILVKPFS